MISIARIFGAVLALTIVFAQPAPAALAQGAPFCGPGARPQFSNGFAALKASLGPVMGEPVECEHSDGDSPDILQQTTTGLAFWRKSTNTPTFTDGYRHWALMPQGLVAWEGSSIDPPSTARGAAPSTGAQPGAGQQGAGTRGIGNSGRTEAAAVPAISAGRRLTPSEFVYRTMDQAPSGSGWPCQSRNPSCGREDWWAQW